MNAPRYLFLRHLVGAQAAKVERLYRAAGWWGPADTPAKLKKWIAASHCLIVASQGERFVGMARAISDRGSDAYIQDLFVDSAVRRRGLGGELVRRLTQRLRRDGLQWIGLMAVPGSASFYDRLGFSILRGHKPMIWKGSAR
jgi:spermidine synthase